MWIVKRFTATAVARMCAPTEFTSAAFSGAVFSSRKKTPQKIAGYMVFPGIMTATKIAGTASVMPDG